MSLPLLLQMAADTLIIIGLYACDESVDYNLGRALFAITMKIIDNQYKYCDSYKNCRLYKIIIVNLLPYQGFF